MLCSRNLPIHKCRPQLKINFLSHVCESVGKNCLKYQISELCGMWSVKSPRTATLVKHSWTDSINQKTSSYSLTVKCFNIMTQSYNFWNCVIFSIQGDVDLQFSVAVSSPISSVTAVPKRICGSFIFFELLSLQRTCRKIHSVHFQTHIQNWCEAPLSLQDLSWFILHFTTACQPFLAVTSELVN